MSWFEMHFDFFISSKATLAMHFRFWRQFSCGSWSSSWAGARRDWRFLGFCEYYNASCGALTKLSFFWFWLTELNALLISPLFLRIYSSLDWLWWSFFVRDVFEASYLQRSVWSLGAFRYPCVCWKVVGFFSFAFLNCSMEKFMLFSKIPCNWLNPIVWSLGSTFSSSLTSGSIFYRGLSN